MLVFNVLLLRCNILDMFLEYYTSLTIFSNLFLSEKGKEKFLQSCR